MRTMRRCIASLSVVMVIGLCAAAAARAAPRGDLVAAKLLVDTSGIEPGKPFTVGVVLTIKPGWHVYWKNPGQTGIATSVDFAVPAGFTVGDLQFPVPERFELPGGLISFGYHDEV